MVPYLVVMVLIKFACGDLQLSFAERIVGGKPANIEDYPYQLALEQHEEHLCGAALIKPNVAITAAHCTLGRSASSLNIRAGSSLVNEGGQVVGVHHICDHPKFHRPTYDYDVSILLLKKYVNLKSSVQVIRLQPISAVVPTGYVGTVTGWGKLKYEGEYPRKLQTVKVPKVDDSLCAYYLQPSVVTNRMICFGYTNGQRDACHGDSGGPLVVNGRLVGIVSWGHGCAFPKEPGVYTKLSHPAIRGHIEQCIAKYK